MKRLRDVAEPSPLLRKAQALIDSVEPLPESQERMLRMRRALERRAAGARGARLPAFGLAAAVVLFGASAFAAVRIYVAVTAEHAHTEQSTAAANARHAAGRDHRAEQGRAASDAWSEAQAPAVARVPAATSQAPRNVQAPAATHTPAVAQGRTVTQAPIAAQTPVPLEEEAEQGASHSTAVSAPSARLGNPAQPHAGTRAPAQSPAARAGSRARKTRQLEADTQATPAVATAAAVATSELVHRAVKALRHDHDPALAARLLEEHRARGVSGPLAEEALSLQIEAASQLGDSRAQQYAREYLARYPEGRYLDVARRALQDAAP